MASPRINPANSLAAILALSIALNVFLYTKIKPIPPATDLRPFQDSIKKLSSLREASEARAKTWFFAYDSVSRLYNNKKPLKHDLQIIESFTPDLRARWLDSVLQGAGLR